jgi:hypothetical protein
MSHLNQLYPHFYTRPILQLQYHIKCAKSTSLKNKKELSSSDNDISDIKLTITRPGNLRVWLTQTKLHTLTLHRLGRARIPRTRSTPISPQILRRDHRARFRMLLHHRRKTRILIHGTSSIRRQMLMSLGNAVGPHIGSISCIVSGGRYSCWAMWQSRVGLLPVVIHYFVVKEIARSGQCRYWGRLIA